MVEPYVKKDPGDIIRAQDWNGMQAQVRAALETHSHTGGEQGPLLTGAAIASDATLEVKSLAASAALSIRGREMAAELEKLDRVINQLKIHTHTGGDQGPQLTGAAIANDAALEVRSLAASATLSVKGRELGAELEKLDQLSRQLKAHTHTGGDQGPQLSGAAIANDAALEVRSLAASAALSVKGRELGAELERLDQLNRRLDAGFVFAGDVPFGLNLNGPTNGLHYYGGQHNPFGAMPDGPVLHGAAGGGLSGAANLALTWDKDSNVSVHGRLTTRELVVTGAVTLNEKLSTKPKMLIASDRFPDQKNGDQNKDSGAFIFLELAHTDARGIVRPSIRFHVPGQFWNRIEGAWDGVHVRKGDATTDNYEDLWCQTLHCESQVGLSDASLKTDIAPLETANALLAGIEPVRFRWKREGPTGRLDIGVLAQQVEQAFPELVHMAGDGIRSVNYSGLTAVLLGALKEQQAEIASIKADLAAMTAARPGALDAMGAR